MGSVRRINEIAPAAPGLAPCSMFYVLTYAGSGLVTVAVGLLATLLGLTRRSGGRGRTRGRVPAHAGRAAPPPRESDQRFLLLSHGVSNTPPPTTVPSAPRPRP